MPMTQTYQDGTPVPVYGKCFFQLDKVLLNFDHYTRMSLLLFILFCLGYRLQNSPYFCDGPKNVSGIQMEAYMIRTRQSMLLAIRLYCSLPGLHQHLLILGEI